VTNSEPHCYLLTSVQSTNGRLLQQAISTCIMMYYSRSPIDSLLCERPQSDAKDSRRGWTKNVVDSAASHDVLNGFTGEPSRLLIDKHGLNMSECGIGSTVRKSVPTGLQKSRCNPVNRRSCGALSKVSWEATGLTNYQETVHLLNSS